MLPLALIPAAASGIAGLFQMLSGQDDLDNLKRPVYKIPGEAQNQFALARQAYADPNTPGASYMRDRVDMNTSNALRAAQEGGGGLSTIAAIQANANNAGREVEMQVARDKQQQLDRLGQMSDIMAKYRDQAWQMNEYAPYADKYAEARQKYGAGMQNMYNGLDRLGAIGTMAMSGGGTQSPTVSPAMAANVANSRAAEVSGQNTVLGKQLQAFGNYWQNQFQQNPDMYENAQYLNYQRLKGQ